ncbi:unnamed protein product, partial [Rotaria magnacalcarata]
QKEFINSKLPAWQTEQHLLMKGKTTRSTIDYSHIKIDNLQYIPLPKSTNNRSMSTSQTSNVLTKDEGKSTEETLDANVAEVDGHV